MLSSLWSEKEETWVSSRVEMRDPRNEVEQSTLIAGSQITEKCQVLIPH